MGGLFPVPPRPSWVLACPVLPTLRAEACTRIECQTDKVQFRDCPQSAECYDAQLQHHGHEQRHIGWRFVDVATPTGVMLRQLNMTVPGAAARFFKGTHPPNPSGTQRAQMARAAILDHIVQMSRAHSISLVDFYRPILEARHRALVQAAAQQDHAINHASAEAAQQAAVDKFIRGSCHDWRWFGLDEPIPVEAGMQINRAADVGAVDYRAPRPLEADTDSRRMPSIAGWPRHLALSSSEAGGD